MEKREQFGSRLGFILISAGCAIGLGNVYRFPIYCGAYGGGIFLLFYLLFLIILGLPVMTAELAVGRASRRSIATAFDVLEKPKQKWHLMKYLGVAGNYLLMFFYTNITGWFCVYMVKYMNGSIMQYKTAEELGNAFGNIVVSPGLNILVTVIVVALGFLICSLGLQKGVERITKVMMVILLLLVTGLAIYSLTLPARNAALKFYFVPSISSVKNYGLGRVISAAMSQSFFTLSLGIGSAGLFGSYIGKERSLTGESVTIICLDTLVALLSGLVIFPAYFTYNPGVTGIGADQAGAGFLFSTFSSIFNNMPSGGRILGSLFFLFMVFAALSTVIAVFENIMSFWLEWTKLKRWQIALINFFIVSVATLPFIICNAGVTFLAKNIFLGRNWGDFEDFLVNAMLPTGCIVYVLFCTSKFGWGWKNYYEEVNAGQGMRMPTWIRPYMSYVLPLIIVVTLVLLFIS